MPAMGVVPAMPAMGVVPAMPATMAALDGSVVHAIVLSGAAGATVGGGRRG
jgi:nucleoside phosphorylase